MGVGMPQFLLLQEFGSHVWSAFGTPPYHVGSSLIEKRDWRDVDVRLVLDDELYAAMGFGDPVFPQRSAKWVALCMAFSALGRQLTGLPVDFQIQQRSYANKEYPGRRSALGFVPWRMEQLADSGGENEGESV